MVTAPGQTVSEVIDPHRHSSPTTGTSDDANSLPALAERTTFMSCFGIVELGSYCLHLLRLELGQVQHDRWQVPLARGPMTMTRQQ
jgi:hypothetical protein